MRRQTLAAAGAAMTALALVVSALAQTSTATAAAKAPTASSKNAFGGFKHLVVIYEENHSFDNLYGQWGKVGSRKVNGLAKATPAHTTQVAQNGQPYKCLLQNDVNLTTGPLSGSCGTESVPQADGTTVTYTSHFTNKAFSIDKYIKATDTTCPPIDNLFGFPNGVLKGQGTPGGCTRDLVHKFYQEQYQINGGQQNRYVTGSDAVGLTMGHYKTADLPIYRYLHGKKAPHYVIADHFFQAAFGGSYLNHQFLVAAQPPLLSTDLDDPAQRPRRRGHGEEQLPALQARRSRRRTTRSPRPAGCRPRWPASPAVTGASTPRCRRPSPPRRTGRRSRSSTTPPRTSPSVTGSPTPA